MKKPEVLSSNMGVDTCKIPLSCTLKISAFRECILLCVIPQLKKNGCFKHTYTLKSLKKINILRNSVFSLEGDVTWD